MTVDEALTWARATDDERWQLLTETRDKDLDRGADYVLRRAACIETLAQEVERLRIELRAANAMVLTWVDKCARADALRDEWKAAYEGTDHAAEQREWQDERNAGIELDETTPRRPRPRHSRAGRVGEAVGSVAGMDTLFRTACRCHQTDARTGGRAMTALLATAIVAAGAWGVGCAITAMAEAGRKPR